ncbi:MAG: hypothetical protein RLY86_1105 [Pseudomonadota bacterium]|jgi:NADPH:quinone reductase-like Zn-dependent oxidoreductase
MDGAADLPETMQAITFHQYGDPDVLRVEEIARPIPGEGEVLVRIEAVGLNPFDTKIRRGYLTWFYKMDLPYVPGSDFAGVVVQAGAGASGGATGLSVGDKVWGLRWPPNQGSYARYLTVPAAAIRRMPESLSFAEAATMPMAAMTAFYALTDMIDLTPADRVLIHAGAGGVGSFAIQIAKQRGAHVATTCSTRNVEFCRSLGADVVVDYTAQDFAEVLKDYDYAIDQLGGEVSLATYRSMKRGGTILLVERGHKLEMEHRAENTARYGVTLREVAFENVPDALDRMRSAVEAGWLKPTLTETIRPDGIVDAHARLQAKHVRGKIALVWE